MQMRSLNPGKRASSTAPPSAAPEQTPNGARDEEEEHAEEEGLPIPNATTFHPSTAFRRITIFWQVPRTWITGISVLCSLSHTCAQEHEGFLQSRFQHLSSMCYSEFHIFLYVSCPVRMRKGDREADR